MSTPLAPPYCVTSRNSWRPALAERESLVESRVMANTRFDEPSGAGDRCALHNSRRKLPPPGPECRVVQAPPPAGFMEFGETPEACALRELFEETGIRGRLTRLFNVYAGADDPRTRAILILYVAEREGGTLAPGDDAIEAGFFPLTALPAPIAF